MCSVAAESCPLHSYALPSSQHTLYVFAVSFTSRLHALVPQHSYWLLPVRHRSAPREEKQESLACLIWGR